MDPKTVAEVEEDNLDLPGLKEKKEEEKKPEVVNEPEKPVVVIPVETEPEKKEKSKPVIPENVEHEEELPPALKEKKEEPKPIEPEIPEEEEDKDKKTPEEESIISLPDEEMGKEKPEPLPTINFKDFGKELGIEVPDNTKEAFVDTYKKTLDEAKKKVEPDLSKFSPQQKLLFDYLQEPEADLMSFFKPLKVFDDFLSKPDDEKILFYLETEEELAPDVAKAELNRIIDEDKLDEYINKVDTITNKARDDYFNELVSTVKKTREDHLERIRIEAEKEKTELKKVVNEMDKFMGMDIPKNVKDAMIKKIDAGKLTIENNNARTQILGHYFNLWGDRILSKIKEATEDEGNKAYGRGVQKVVSVLHNTPIEPELPGGRNAPRKEETPRGKLPQMKDIDKDSVSGFPSS